MKRNSLHHGLSSHPRYGLELILLFSFGLLFTGCNSTARWIDKYGTSMDAAQATVEAYGTISMSTPLLSEPTADFAFGLHRTAKEYFDEAKASVQGSVSTSEQASQGLSIGAAVQLDPVQSLNYADALQSALNQRAQASRREQLVGEAAQARYQAALELAAQETDAVKRAELIAQAKTAYATALADPAARTAMPGVSTGNVPAAATVPNNLAGPAEILSSAKLTSPFALRTPTAPTLSNRSALVTAAGDKAVEAMFNALGKPEELKRFGNTEIFIALTMVSLNPGWLTREGFAADIGIQTDLDYRLARDKVLQGFLKRPDIDPKLKRALVEDMGFAATKWGADYVCQASSRPDASPLAESVSIAPTPLALPSDLIEERAIWPDSELDAAKLKRGEKPAAKPEFVDARDYAENKMSLYSPISVAAAMSPMNDVQTLDAAASWRRRVEFILALSLAFRSAGQEAQAGMLQRWLKQNELDAQTRTVSSTVTAYSYGTVFGYHIKPSFHAVANPDELRSKPGLRLDDMAFPALITVGLIKDQVRLVVVRTTIKREGKTYDTFALAEPRLRFTQLPRWTPIDARYAGSRLSVTQQLHHAADLAAAEDALGELTSRGVKNVADFKIRELLNRANGAQQSIEFPIDKLVPPVKTEENKPALRPVLHGSVPERIELPTAPTNGVTTSTHDLALFGEGLDQLDLAHITSPFKEVSVDAATVKLTGSGLITLKVTVAANANGIVLGFPSKESKGVAVAHASVPTYREKIGAKVVVRVEKDENHREVSFPVNATTDQLGAAQKLLESPSKPSIGTTGSDSSVLINVGTKPPQP